MPTQTLKLPEKAGQGTYVTAQRGDRRIDCLRQFQRIPLAAALAFALNAV